MPVNYDAWISGTTPHTHKEAVPTRVRSVSSVPAIRVRGATYRDCKPIDGVFELVNESPQTVAGEERYEVYCAWFGVKPQTKFPRLSVVPGSFDIIHAYSGDVIDNIST